MVFHYVCHHTRSPIQILQLWLLPSISCIQVSSNLLQSLCTSAALVAPCLHGIHKSCFPCHHICSGLCIKKTSPVIDSTTTFSGNGYLLQKGSKEGSLLLQQQFLLTLHPMIWSLHLISFGYCTLSYQHKPQICDHPVSPALCGSVPSDLPCCYTK